VPASIRFSLRYLPQLRLLTCLETCGQTLRLQIVDPRQAPHGRLIELYGFHGAVRRAHAALQLAELPIELGSKLVELGRSDVRAH
jgi:hypothetical protein